MKTSFRTLCAIYYSTPVPVKPAEVRRDVRAFRARQFHWPARDRGIAPGWGNHAARRAYALEGSALFLDSSRLGISARRLFIP